MTKTRLICENKSSSEKRKSWQQKIRGTGKEGGGRKGGEGEGKREKERKKRERWRKRDRGKRREREEGGGRRQRKREKRRDGRREVPFLICYSLLLW